MLAFTLCLRAQLNETEIRNGTLNELSDGDIAQILASNAGSGRAPSRGAFEWGPINMLQEGIR